MQAAGDRLRHRCLYKTQAIGELVYLFLSHNHMLCKSSVYRSSNSDIIGAEMLLRILAEIALCAHIIRVAAYPVANFEFGNAASNLRHNAGKFMARNQRRSNSRGAPIPVKNMYIRSTYATILHLNHDLIVF